MFNKSDIFSCCDDARKGLLILSAFYGDEIISKTYAGYKLAEAERLFLDYLNSELYNETF